MAKNVNSDDAGDNKNNKKNSNRQNYYLCLIQLTYINFIQLNLTNFWNKKKELFNLSHSVAILVMGTVGQIDESMARAKIRLYWSHGHASCEGSIAMIG